MAHIIVDFRFDRWEVIRKYGFHETLIAFFATRKEAQERAKIYRHWEGK